MEQGASQNKNDGFFKKYQNWVIAVLIVAAVVVYFIVQSQGNDGSVAENGDENGEQTQDGENQTPTPTVTPTPTPTGSNSPSPDGSDAPGNVHATGTLRESDNTTRGNLMVESDKGTIYIATQRDFSSLIGQSVNLNAEGTLDSFKFLGFQEAVTPAPSDMGGAPDADSPVTFTGRLQDSDNTDKGNYSIVSGGTTVYLKTVRDYSAWLNSEVILKAEGSLASFTSAYLVQK